MSDLVIVSNRGPFSFTSELLREAQDRLDRGIAPTSPSFGEGGLVQAMSGLLKSDRWNPTWIGASMGDRDIDVARGHYTHLFRRMSEEGQAPAHFPHIEIEPDGRMHFRYREYDFYMRSVFFDTRHMHSYYSKFANGFLWPLMHLTRTPLFYKKTKAFPRPSFERDDFIQYTSSGVTFANTVIDEIRKSRAFRSERNVVVWSQDYHLMQIADSYRALISMEGFSMGETKRICLGQFMHTPFFDIHEIQGLIREDKRNWVKTQVYDPFGETMESVLQKLTWGLLANDFIGFHTKDYCDNFLEALEEWFPVEIKVAGQAYEIWHQGRVTTVGALPIGLDVDKILAEVSEDRALEYPLDGGSLQDSMMEEKAKGTILFGGLERCDYTKGLIERMGIFQHALAKLRAMGREARFFQVTAPSRHENPDYRNLTDLIGREVTALNSRLGEDCVIHLGDGIPVPQNYRFMRHVDVMLVTPLEDGLNLVAFEYILSQKYRRPGQRGILVLSTSGASRVLKSRGFAEEDGIIYVNPLRPKDAAEKLVEAIVQGRYLSEKVIRYTEKERRVDDWAEKNMKAILECRKTP